MSLASAVTTHKEAHDDAKAALRDLGCKVCRNLCRAAAILGHGGSGGASGIYSVGSAGTTSRITGALPLEPALPTTLLLAAGLMVAKP